MFKSWQISTGCACVITLGLVTSANAASFIPIGDIPNHFESSAYGISADGMVAVGRVDTLLPGTNIIETAPFRWTQEDGMVSLGKLADTSEYAYAVQTSAVGSVITGTDVGVHGFEAFRWTTASGMQGLGALPGPPSLGSEATDISADGSVIVGRLCGTLGSFIWTETGGIVQQEGEIEVNAISGNSSCLVGVSYEVGQEAYLWTQGNGLITSGMSIGRGVARGVSYDCSVVVGMAPLGVNDVFEAFRWTQEDGMISLGSFGGEPGSDAWGVSADGSIIVGIGEDPDGEDVAFIWDETNGIRSLQEVLTGLGLNLDGWKLHHAFDISADGSSIVGFGDNPDGHREAWIANISKEPVPDEFSWEIYLPAILHGNK